MGASETLNNELTETLGYLIDKFNLTLEISGNQIKEFSEQMATRIITWEMIESIIYLLAHSIVILAIVLIFKYFKIKSFKTLKAMYDSVDDYVTKEEKNTLDKCMKHALTKIAGLFIILLAISGIFREIKDIVLCLVFPEKIILDFIGHYI